jgi:L-arabinonolactonase
MEIGRVGTFTVGWGESLVWDDRRERLWFVDCAGTAIHWIDGDGDELHTITTPSMPTGVVPAEDGRLVVVLDDGLHALDVEAGTWELVVGYPVGLGARANDACADLAGNLITGTLNMGPAHGSTWRWSLTEGWTLLDDDISNTNGPTVGIIGGEETLVIGDTAAHYVAAPYDSATGEKGERRLFGDVTDLDGHPDGATLDDAGGYWAALVGGAQLARFTADGLDRTVPLPVTNPTDVTFGGPDLDRLYVVSIGLGPDVGALDGALLVIDGLPERGRPEPRVRLA